LKSCDGTPGWTTLLGQITRDMIKIESMNDRWPDGTPTASGLVSGFMRQIGEVLSAVAMAGEQANA
jgi:hypothetical protein